MNPLTFLILPFALIVGSFTPKPITWKWSVNPADLGGMTTNDYLTNIVFNVLSVTNCTIPTNLWPVFTNYTASTMPSPDGVNWSNTIVTDGNTRFFIVQAVNQNGGSGPFSLPGTWVPSPPVGTQPRVLGP